MKLVCNPMNLDYRYQITTKDGGLSVYREGADPTLILFKDTYYLFASKSAGFWYSDDLHDWKYRETPELPINDYAPDVREIGGAVIFSASRLGEMCTFYRSGDPKSEPFTPVTTLYEFWDPNLFQDDDGRVYFYWGCTNTQPIWGMEVDPVSFEAMSEKTALLGEHEDIYGWERVGENDGSGLVKRGTKPYIEGSYMNKYDGKYYLQYAAPGTQLNLYSDGVYVSDNPLGPFSYQKHNPVSSKPGGFMTSAGHGSTFQDKYGNWWHASSMRISQNNIFERRIGLFPCAFDADGVMYCNQNFADYPFTLPEGKREDENAIAPEWMLLSYKCGVSASSSQEGCAPEKAADEDARTCWAAQKAGDDEWLELDLGKVCDVNAIQINFFDYGMQAPPESSLNMMEDIIFGKRHIVTQPQQTQYLLELSVDKQTWYTAKWRNCEGMDYSHDLIELNEMIKARYVRVSMMKMPFDGVPAISGLRVFGNAKGDCPDKVASVKVKRVDPLDAKLSWEPAQGAQGYNVRYGVEKDKLYSSWQIYGNCELMLSTLGAGQIYYAAVDSYNSSGVTPGDIFKIDVD
jgi:hypothetical protein